MRAVSLSSSLIARIAYDDARRTLKVRFRDDRAYLYFDVPPSIFQAMKSAPSAGRFYNEEVKARYRCTFDPDRKRYRPDAAA